MINLETRIGALQKRIGYFFNDIGLLQRAVTHSSSNENFSNERMEFVGDRVLGLVMANYLYDNFIEEEGRLAKKLNFWVSRQSCAEVARKINLGDVLIISHSEEENGGRFKDNLLGNACEALIAAIYFDSSFEKAQEIVINLWSDLLNKPTPVTDNKSALQEWTQSLSLGIPIYEIIDKNGADHEPIFTVKVSVPTKGEALGIGKSRRLAEHEAAKNFLKQFNAFGDEDFF